MKTPRLALFAFLALALASLANAALPTWTVVEEGPRSWARVFFTVGKENKTLRCRYNECKPERKTVSDLYVIAPVGKATPTKVTIYKMVPRSKWNPKYYTDGPYDKVPEVINANAQPYSSELSNFKLDNTGAKLMVVQGDKKFPASTDINEAQFNSYDQMKVSPPAKMADDVLKPDAPAAGPENGGRRGRGGNGGSGDAAKKWWCDPKTGDKYSAARGRRGSVLLASKDAVCKKEGGSTPDPVVTKPPVETAVTLALVDADETRWLTKTQAAAYADQRAAAKDDAARKAVDAKYRALVEAQIRPEAAAAYKAAHAAPVAEAAAKIKAAIGGVEMWGGKDLKAIVAPFQEKADPATAKLLEIQLSKADWELLKKKPDDLRAYTASRLSANGASGDGTVFDANYLDPVALRLGAEAARKAVGSGAPAPNPADGELVPLLTEDEKKLLTPTELKNYESIYNSAPAPKEKDKNLQAEAKRLRDLIASEGRGKSPAYKAPGSLDEFNKLPEWQRKKFCDELRASTANLTADTRGVELGGGSAADAKSQLAATDTKSATNGTATAAGSSAPAWAADACKPYNAPPVTTNPTGPRAPVAGSVPTPNGVDAEAKAKEKSKWLTQDLLTSAAKGAMVGLLVGSLFGPAGLILGPLIGGALFYGLTKITS